MGERRPHSSPRNSTGANLFKAGPRQRRSLRELWLSHPFHEDRFVVIDLWLRRTSNVRALLTQFSPRVLACRPGFFAVKTNGDEAAAGHPIYAKYKGAKAFVLLDARVRLP